MSTPDQFPVDLTNWDFFRRAFRATSVQAGVAPSALLAPAGVISPASTAIHLFSLPFIVPVASRCLILSQVRLDSSAVASWFYTYAQRLSGPVELAVPGKQMGGIPTGIGGLVDLATTAQVPRFGMSMNWNYFELKEGDYVFAIGAYQSGGSASWSTGESFALALTFPL